MNEFLQLALLNQKKGIANITLESLDRYLLSSEEKDLVLKYQPGNKLIIYGTLAPGQPNHHKISHIEGEWKPALLKGGKLEIKGWGAELGYNGFVPTPESDHTDIACFILFSNYLDKNWDYLDHFEGDGYRRVLGIYELEDGERGIGCLYAINE